jgi:hypothetical protein
MVRINYKLWSWCFKSKSSTTMGKSFIRRSMGIITEKA